MSQKMGALGQMAAMKIQGPKGPKPLDLSGVDQSLQRSGNMLRKGISRMRQMNRGGKVKLAEGGKVTSILKAAKKLKPSQPVKTSPVKRMESPAAFRIRKTLLESDPDFFGNQKTLDSYVDDYMLQITNGETSLEELLQLIQS